jgi:RNA polymerase sigma-70 factor (ECF subfamily)
VDIEEVAAQLPGAEGARDRAIDLQRCLLLPEEQRAALLLVALEDMSYAQLSRVLNVPLGTVMSRLARARVRLQDLMEGAPPPAAGRPGLRRLK